MSFSKRSIPLRRTPATSSDATLATTSIAPSGVKPSPVTGKAAISTGCASLDTLLAANSGLILGQSLLMEETGTTDYASALLRCYAAEGVLQNHQVHVVGVGDAWGRDLPGVVEDTHSSRETKSTAPPASATEAERMKIAWRYERMGAHGERTTVRNAQQGDLTAASNAAEVFCHTFDLTKRLTPPPSAKPIRYHQLSSNAATSPFENIITSLQEALGKSEPSTIHRVVMPSLLSPIFYPPQSSLPNHVLAFLHSLRALLRTHASRLSAMLSLPLSLYPRSTGLTRWIERFVDGVVELAPFPHSFDTGRVPGAGGKEEERPQGMVKVHTLPVFTERGGGEGRGVASGGGDDLCFVVSRRKFLIRPFDLPPVEGDTDAQKGGQGMDAKAMEF